MRVGVIGCGSIGKIHIRNLKRIGAEVVAACDIDEKELKYVKSEFGVEHLYTDYHDLIARSDLDAVVVATPNYLHHEMTVNALKEGKHVLCEKPPAITARQVKEMYEASRKYGRALLIGLTMRFRADSRALKEYVEKVG
ncbi:MAG: gfo/Idh/MocA family oxidoreductase, partial [Thermoprotei archaeon]